MAVFGEIKIFERIIPNILLIQLFATFFCFLISVLYTHMQIHAHIYIYTYIHTGYILTQWIMTSEDFFKKYISHFIWKIRKGFTVRGSWRPNKDCNTLTLTLIAISVVSFSFSWCSTGGPGAHSAGFLYYILSLTHLIFNLPDLQLVWFPTLWGSRGPLRPGVAFPTTSRL